MLIEYTFAELTKRYGGREKGIYVGLHEERKSLAGDAFGVLAGPDADAVGSGA